MLNIGRSKVADQIEGKPTAAASQEKNSITKSVITKFSFNGN